MYLNQGMGLYAKLQSASDLRHRSRDRHLGFTPCMRLSLKFPLLSSSSAVGSDLHDVPLH